jgi:23S rRNA pseudouridine1911/1915/1917 synthase
VEEKAQAAKETQKKMTESGDQTAAITLAADENSAGVRIDLFLSGQNDDLTRSRVQKLIEKKLVIVNGEVCDNKNYRIKAGDQVLISLAAPEELAARPEDIELDIVYEDKDLLVINKKRGMVVHPAPGHQDGTMVNALLGHCKDLSGIGGVIRPGIVHRLDKDTSGLLIVAKNDYAHNSLAEQLKARTLKRVYFALVCGRVNPQRGRIEAPVGRHLKHRKKMAVIAGGRDAVTRYRVIKHFKRYSLLKLKLETGRTHQIRVHMAHIGFPVVGDPLYGPGSHGDLPGDLATPQALHARALSFEHPRTGVKMNFSAPLPDGFRKLLHWLHRHDE